MRGWLHRYLVRRGSRYTPRNATVFAALVVAWPALGALGCTGDELAPARRDGGAVPAEERPSREDAGQDSPGTAGIARPGDASMSASATFDGGSLPVPTPVFVDAGDGGVGEPLLCELGVSDVTGTQFVVMEPGVKLPLRGGGQTSLFVDLALRIFEPNEPDIHVVVRRDASALSDAGPASSSTELEALPDGWFRCNDSGYCDLLGVLVSASPLADGCDLQNLPVTVEASVVQDGQEYCTATIAGELFREGAVECE